jgi:hypothetical protein
MEACGRHVPGVLLDVGQRVEPPRLLQQQVMDLELPVRARVLRDCEDATDLTITAMPRHCQAELTDLWDVLYLHKLISFFVMCVCS